MVAGIIRNFESWDIIFRPQKCIFVCKHDQVDKFKIRINILVLLLDTETQYGKCQLSVHLTSFLPKLNHILSLDL